MAASLLFPALVACNSADTPEAPVDPKQALLASTKEFGKGNFRFAMTDHEATAEGVVDAGSRSAQMLMKLSDPDADMEMEIDFIVVDNDTWVKIDFGGALDGVPGMEALTSGKYLHLDPAKVKEIDDLSIDFDKADPADVDLLLKAVTEVKEDAKGAYSGKIDLSKATKANLIDEAILDELGDEAKALAFTAKVDAQGRLTEFAVDVPAAGEVAAHQLKVAYSDYGSAPAPKKPADSEVAEAPEEVYEMFS
ncbi:MAG TPA: hypothetical protein VFX61_00125 [Micromonosporaceae bacterium]|nr:hypothetical protein [Micromonosporaceae bacterium]